MASNAADEEYDDDFEEESNAGDATPPPLTPPPTSIDVAAANCQPGSLQRSPSLRIPWAVVMLDELDLHQRLASGAMGSVHAATYRNRPVAVKKLHDTSPNALQAVETELLVHASLQDPRIVQVLGANLVPPGCCIVMEQCECSLFERLHRRPDELSRRTSMAITIQIAEGMRYLHTRRPPVVHRDLKSHNVLLDANGDAKLCDFGLVNTREVTAGTPNYMAPELFNAKPFSQAVDVFAFGVLLNEIWGREVPWDGYQPQDIRQKVTAGERPPTPRTMPFACEALLKKLWHTTPSVRPTFAEALPSLEMVLEGLPPDRSSSLSKSMPLDALDSLDQLSMSLPRSRR